MRNYTTQMDAARKGIVTPEIRTVAEKEQMDTDKLMKLVAEDKASLLQKSRRTRRISPREFPVRAISTTGWPTRAGI